MLFRSKFRQTLDKGLRLLDEATGGMGEGATLPGDVAFKLYDTFGFPYDLTEDALRTQGITVDRAGFDASSEEHTSELQSLMRISYAGFCLTKQHTSQTPSDQTPT